MEGKQQIIDGLMIAWDAFKQTGHNRCAESVRMAIEMLLDAPNVIKCKECNNWVPGYISFHRNAGSISKW